MSTPKDAENNADAVSGMSEALDSASGMLDVGPDGVFDLACMLFNDNKVMMAATNPVTNEALGEALMEGDKLAQFLLSDDVEGLGQLMQDKIIEYVITVAKQRIVKGD